MFLLSVSAHFPCAHQLTRFKHAFSFTSRSENVKFHPNIHNFVFLQSWYHPLPHPTPRAVAGSGEDITAAAPCRFFIRPPVF